MVNVMTLSPGDWPVTAGEAAATIATGHGAEQVVGDGACCPPVIHYRAATVHDPVNHTITQMLIGSALCQQFPAARERVFAQVNVDAV